MKKIKQIEIGTQFWNLEVIGQTEIVDTRGFRHGASECLCHACGSKVVIMNSTLRRGGARSCGCARMRKLNDMCRKHGCGNRKNRLFRIWVQMKYRCSCNRPEYANYAGRGIRVCDEWRNSFVEFRKWAMSHGYSDKLSIDRIDPNGNYEPSNCRWVRMSAQQRNKRNNRRILVNGLNLCVSEWADKLGVSKHAMYQAIHRGEDPVKYVMRILSK